MTDLFRSFVLAVLLPAMVLFIWINVHTITECRAAGGTTVRGLIWLECIR